MSTNEPGDPTLFPATVTVPDDGDDPRQAVTFALPIEQLTDRTAWLAQHVSSELQTWTVPLFPIPASYAAYAADPVTAMSDPNPGILSPGLIFLGCEEGTILEIHVDWDWFASDPSVFAMSTLIVREDTNGTPSDVDIPYARATIAGNAATQPQHVHLHAFHPIETGGDAELIIETLGIGGTDGGSFDVGTDAVYFLKGITVSIRRYQKGIGP